MLRSRLTAGIFCLIKWWRYSVSYSISQSNNYEILMNNYGVLIIVNVNILLLENDAGRVRKKSLLYK